MLPSFIHLLAMYGVQKCMKFLGSKLGELPRHKYVREYGRTGHSQI